MKSFSLTYSTRTLNIREIAISGYFRWKKFPDKSYIFPVGRYLMKIQTEGKGKVKITLYSDLSDIDAKKYIENYFNLNLDYEKIIKSIEFDPYVKVALKKSYGLRVLNQDPIETIFSFLLSQNNTVENVTRCVERISKKVAIKDNTSITLDNEVFYPFPSVESLAKLRIKDYEEMKCGYRSRYLNSTAERIVRENIDVNKLEKLDSDKLRSKLLEFNGIGEKVADCILLYSMKKFEVVPMDTWVEKASIELYGLKKNCTNKDVRKFFEDRFGKYAGWAHLFIFHHARMYSRKNMSLKESFIL